jgi:hypothetical protein
MYYLKNFTIKTPYQKYSHNKYLLYSTYSNKPKPPNNDLLIYAILVGIYFTYIKK